MSTPTSLAIINPEPAAAAAPVITYRCVMLLRPGDTEARAPFAAAVFPTGDRAAGLAATEQLLSHPLLADGAMLRVLDLAPWRQSQWSEAERLQQSAEAARVAGNVHEADETLRAAASILEALALVEDASPGPQPTEELQESRAPVTAVARRPYGLWGPQRIPFEFHLVLAAFTLFVATWLQAALDGTLSPIAIGLPVTPWVTTANVPQQVFAQANPHEVDLGWRPASTEITGYNIYRATEPGGLSQRLNSTPIRVHFYRDTQVSSGTYYYVVEAVSSAHRASPARSSEISVVVPGSDS